MDIPEDFNPVIKSVQWTSQFRRTRPAHYWEIFEVYGKRVEVLIENTSAKDLSSPQIKDIIRLNMARHKPFKKLIQKMVYARYVQKYGDLNA